MKQPLAQNTSGESNYEKMRLKTSSERLNRFRASKTPKTVLTEVTFQLLHTIDDRSKDKEMRTWLQTRSAG